MKISIERLKHYSVYFYQHIDYFGALIDPEDFYKEFYADNIEREDYKIFLNGIQKLFKKYGWDGDGALSLIWIPPFIETNSVEDTTGEFIWHVKQSNNGVSYVASESSLPFKRIQNDAAQLNPSAWMSQHILEDDCDKFLSRIGELTINLKTELSEIESSIQSSQKQIRDKILGYTQCEIIAELHSFLENCYLSLLIEVLQNGNTSSLRLRKSTVKLNLEKHHHDEEAFGEPDIETANWLSMSTIVSDIYWSYQFDSFKEKLSKLTKGTDYNIKTEVREEIIKHVIIRNCIQHHFWQLDKGTLIPLGRDHLFILTSEDGSYSKIAVWQKIELTVFEIDRLVNNLRIFVNDFSNHIRRRIKTKHYIERKKPSDNTGT